MQNTMFFLEGGGDSGGKITSDSAGKKGEGNWRKFYQKLCKMLRDEDPTFFSMDPDFNI